MKNVTITLDEETVRWVRIEAAKQGTSVSRMLGAMLRERRLRETSYETAAQRFLERKPAPLKKTGEHYPSRDNLHDRSLLR